MKFLTLLKVTAVSLCFTVIGVQAMLRRGTSMPERTSSDGTNERGLLVSESTVFRYLKDGVEKEITQAQIDALNLRPDIKIYIRVGLRRLLVIEKLVAVDTWSKKIYPLVEKKASALRVEEVLAPSEVFQTAAESDETVYYYYDTNLKDFRPISMKQIKRLNADPTLSQSGCDIYYVLDLDSSGKCYSEIHWMEKKAIVNGKPFLGRHFCCYQVFTFEEMQARLRSASSVEEVE